MSESLDVWYQRELDYFRSTGAQFAERFPKIANRLSLSATGIKDPHVERLIQSFAYMNARTRHKLDDSFPELVDAMLGILYPHMLSPVPAMSRRASTRCRRGIHASRRTSRTRRRA